MIYCKTNYTVEAIHFKQLFILIQNKLPYNIIINYLVYYLRRI